jgi:hypothetical protein
MSADVVMPVRERPDAMRETAVRIFIRAARRLDYAVQRYEFRDYELPQGLLLSAWGLSLIYM